VSLLKIFSISLLINLWRTFKGFKSV
jgi:hypothetical protein